jgi:hypothetical protein
MTLIPSAARYSCAAAGADAGGRSEWTVGAGRTCARCSPSAAPGGPAVLRDRRPHSRAALVGFGGPHRVSPPRRRDRCQATLRASSTTSCACGRARPGASVAQRHPAPTRARQPRHHEHLLTGHRHRGDHLHCARAPSTDDVGDGWPSALKNRCSKSASADAVLALAVPTAECCFRPTRA